MATTSVAGHARTDSADIWRALKERTTRGLLLYNRERARIHRLTPMGADVWAVPSSRGGFYRVNLLSEACGCEDFRYACTDRESGEPIMNCKHIIAAAITRARRERPECAPCYGTGAVLIGVEEDGIEWSEPTPCRRCGGSGRA